MGCRLGRHDGTDIFQSDGHGLVNTDRVFLSVGGGETLPAGLDATTLYYVITRRPTRSNSSDQRWPSVAVTGLNEFTWHKTVPEVFGSAGNLVVTANALDILVF